jgi:hypothetical protein
MRQNCDCPPTEYYIRKGFASVIRINILYCIGLHPRIPSILRNRKVHYHLFSSAPLVPFLIQSTFSHILLLRSSLILSSHVRLSRPVCLFPSGSPTKTVCIAFLCTCPARLIIDFVTRIKRGGVQIIGLLIVQFSQDPYSFFLN